jgi:hypothetical protein
MDGDKRRTGQDGRQGDKGKTVGHRKSSGGQNLIP